MADKIYVGRRKTSVARVRISSGSGQVTLNGRELEDYFRTEKHRSAVTEPFDVLDQTGRWDVLVNVNGGGITGQADAVKLGVARALADADPDWRAPLKEAGLLTRDARHVERKKYGLKKARKAPQFSKR